MFARGDQAGNMCHIDKQQRANFVCDCAQSWEVNNTGISTCSSQDHLRLIFNCKSFNLIVVERFSFAVNAVRNDIVKDTGEVHRMTMGQVATVIQTH